MLSEHLKCSLPLPTSHIVGKMHMSSKCTQHVITGFQAPSPPVGVAKRRRRSRTASTSPELSPGDECNSVSGTSLYCGSYGETSDSSSSCSGRVFSKSRGDRLPCSCERFPWDHRRTLECQLLAAGLSDRHRGAGELGVGDEILGSLQESLEDNV